MKVLIISVKAGYGHHSTGNAIIEHFSECGVECEMLDMFEYINHKLADSIDNGYMFSTKYFPKIYGKAYDMLDKHDKRTDKYSPMSVLSKIVSHKLHDYVKRFNPDAIIGTHSYACMMMTYLREAGVVSCPLIGVVTDFTVHPFWENTNLDYYVIADALLSNNARKKGIPPQKILPFGIPVRKNFSTKKDKLEARKELKIDNKTTILLMMGSMGFGNILKEIAEIDRLEFDFQVICVCGKNKKKFKEISHHTWNKNIITLGFVNNVDLLMDASDCIITKPGGLTTSEFLAKQLPAVIMNPIRGQEDRNTEFLVNAGAAVMVTKTFGIAEALSHVLNCPWRLETLKQSVKNLGKPNATKDLCDFVINLVKKNEH